MKSLLSFACPNARTPSHSDFSAYICHNGPLIASPMLGSERRGAHILGVSRVCDDRRLLTNGLHGLRGDHRSHFRSVCIAGSTLVPDEPVASSSPGAERSAPPIGSCTAVRQRGFPGTSRRGVLPAEDKRRGRKSMTASFSRRAIPCGCSVGNFPEDFRQDFRRVRARVTGALLSKPCVMQSGCRMASHFDH